MRNLRIASLAASRSRPNLSVLLIAQYSKPACLLFDRYTSRHYKEISFHLFLAAITSRHQTYRDGLMTRFFPKYKLYILQNCFNRLLKKIFLLGFFALCACAFADVHSCSDSIALSYKARRTNQDKILICYTEQATRLFSRKGDNVKTSFHDVTSGTDNTRFIVEYVHLDNISRLKKSHIPKNDDTERDILQVGKDIYTFHYGEGAAFSTHKRGEIASGDCRPAAMDYWCFTGFTPEWIHLNKDYEIEYNFASIDSDKMRCFADDNVTTVSFRNRQTWVFENRPIRLVHMIRWSKIGKTMEATMKYNASVADGLLPTEIAWTEFADDGATPEFQNVIQVQEVSENEEEIRLRLR